LVHRAVANRRQRRDLSSSIAAGFQFCLLDPEGDYADLEGVVVIGDAKSPPRVPNIIALLMDPRQSVVVNLLGVDLAERPRLLSELVPAVAELHNETARPHWLVIDEAYHLLPALWNGAPLMLPRVRRDRVNYYRSQKYLARGIAKH
jgi:hypothetical protein